MANLLKAGVFLLFMPGQLCRVKKRKAVLDTWELAWCSLLVCGPLVEYNTCTDHQHQRWPFCDANGWRPKKTTLQSRMNADKLWSSSKLQSDQVPYPGWVTAAAFPAPALVYSFLLLGEITRVITWVITEFSWHTVATPDIIVEWIS